MFQSLLSVCSLINTAFDYVFLLDYGLNHFFVYVFLLSDRRLKVHLPKVHLAQESTVK